MKLKITLLVLALFMAKISTAQTTQFRHRVLIQKKHKVLQTVNTPKTDTVSLKKGDLVSNQFTYKKKDTTLTVNRIDTVRYPKLDLGDKSVPEPRVLRGWASVAFDKDDKSKLNINYWLDPSHLFKWGTIVDYVKKGIPNKRIVFKNDTSMLLSRVTVANYDKFNQCKKDLDNLEKAKAVLLVNLTTSPSDTLRKQVDKLNRQKQGLLSVINEYAWLDDAKEMILEYDTNGDKVAYYARKYQDNYFVKLKNREYVSLWYQTGEFGALTIPFKIRPKFTRGGKDISSEFTADWNAGTYVGFTVGKAHYSYRTGEEVPPTKFQVSIGPFLSVSRVEIDSTNTISEEKPLEEKKAVATLSPGIGLMFSVRELRFGAFMGKDYTLGKTGKKWDYRGKTWFGFGFGYNLALIWGALK